MKAIGFVVGQTDWSRMMDPTEGSSALCNIKYIEKAPKFRRLNQTFLHELKYIIMNIIEFLILKNYIFKILINGTM